MIIGNRSDTLLTAFENCPEPVVISILGIESTDNLNTSNTRQKLYKLDDYNEVAKPFPSEVFILNEIELSSINLHFLKIRNSIWWNLYGYYFIKNTQESDGCNNAHLFLKIAWEFDILNAIFLCSDSSNRIWLYAFNPFMNHAPEPWENEDIYHQENGHPFTVFKLMYISEIKLICNNLWFEKTLSLGGYPIQALSFIDINQTVNKNHKIRGLIVIENIIVELMGRTLDASLKLTINTSLSRGMLYKNGTVDGDLAELSKGKFDYIIQHRIQTLLPKNQYYIYWQASLCYVHYKKLLTVDKYIMKIVLGKHIFFFVGSYMVLTIVFMYLKKERFSQSALDLLRSLIGVSMLHQPRSIKHKFIFIAFIFVFMTMTFYIQGKLYSLVTTPDYENFALTKMDLLRLNYKIYASEFVWQTCFSKNKFLSYNRFHIVKDFIECAAKIEQERNYKSICADFCDVLKYVVSDNSTIHIVEDVNDNWRDYVVLVSRDNFSLFKRFTTIFRYLEESGLMSRIRKLDFYFGHKKSENSTYGEIALYQLSLPLTLFLFGLLFSSFVFLVEVSFVHCKRIYFNRYSKRKFFKRTKFRK